MMISKTATSQAMKSFGNTEARGQKTENQARRIEYQARRIEYQARRAESQAQHAEDQAGKVELDVRAYNHKATVEANLAKAYGEKAATQADARARYHQAETEAADKKNLAKRQKDEATAKAKPYKEKTKAEESEAKKLSNPRDKSIDTEKVRPEVRKARIAAREAKLKASQIESEAREADAEVRKANLDVKKAKFELEEAIAAIDLQAKHAEDASQANIQANIKKTEIEDRKIEAQFRWAESAARMAQAKAIRAGNLEQAEALKSKARVHQVAAINKQMEIKEKQNKPKRRPRQPAKESEEEREEEVTLIFNRSERLHLATSSLISKVHGIFKKIPEPIRQNSEKNIQPQISTNAQNITTCDCLMSGLAIFGLKYASLLQFDCDSREGGCIHHNLHTLYKVETNFSDTYMRECLDLLDPSYLRPAFKVLFTALQRGKELKKYIFCDGHYLLLGDGTNYFSSNSIHCKNCCQKHSRDGNILYYHQMMSAAIVHPNYPTVIPLCPEAILNQDGSKKNDCERRASERLYRNIRREHPHLKFIVSEDALGANGPHILLFKELNIRFIIVAKPEGNKFIFEFIKNLPMEEYNCVDGEFTCKFRFINNIPLNDSHNEINVNFFEAFIYEKGGVLSYYNSWITDIIITKDNIYTLYKGGRARWKIENEEFNTLKNQGYHFEHNYGHGFKYLSTVFALLMFLAFFIDQIQQSCYGIFQAALVKMKSKVRLWARMKGYFLSLFIDSWKDLWAAITFGIAPVHLKSVIRPLDTS